MNEDDLRAMLTSEVALAIPGVVGQLAPFMSPGTNQGLAFQVLTSELAILYAREKVKDTPVIQDLLVSKRLELDALVERQRLIQAWADIEARDKFLNHVGTLALNLGIKVATAALLA